MSFVDFVDLFVIYIKFRSSVIETDGVSKIFCKKFNTFLCQYQLQRASKTLSFYCEAQIFIWPYCQWAFSVSEPNTPKRKWAPFIFDLRLPIIAKLFKVCFTICTLQRGNEHWDIILTKI